jgi:hypothetical protein
MIIIKNNPVGIDERIDVLQKGIFSSLIKTWNLSESKYNCYPRCYRNQTKDGYTAEMFTGGNDYEELYINDQVSVTSFFGVGQNSTIQADQVQSDIHLIFSLNLNEVKPGTQRNDEEVRQDVLRVLDTFGAAHGFIITSQTTGIDKILAEYPGSRKSIGLKYTDMHPNLWFRFDMITFYQNC